MFEDSLGRRDSNCVGDDNQLKETRVSWWAFPPPPPSPEAYLLMTSSTTMKSSYLKLDMSVPRM